MGNDERLEDTFRQILGLGLVFWDAIKEDTPRQEIRGKIETLAEALATATRLHQDGLPLDLTADWQGGHQDTADHRARSGG